jgi:N-acetylneuraminic acid mutarotase
MAMFNGGQGLLYEPVSGTWTPTATLSGSGFLTGIGAWEHNDGTTDVVAVLDPGAIYINATLYRYTVATDTWSLIGTINKGQRYQYETAMVGDHFYLIGGYANGAYLKSVGDANLATSQYGPIKGLMSSGLFRTFAAAINGKLYILGGDNYGGPNRDVQILDPATGAISAGPAMFGGRYGAATAVADGKLYVMGGRLAGVSAPSTNVTVLSAGASAP